MTSAVDKQPASARPLAGRCGRLLTHSSYTTRWDMTINPHYDASYFAWQKSIGAFGGMANKRKFAKYIKADRYSR